MVITSMTYEEAMDEVKNRVATSHTSFGAGMAILPKARREGMYALYGFCREVDDIADDSANSEIAAQGLKLWRKLIGDLFREGKADNAITIALVPAIKAYGLVEKDFQDIIDGMEMDSVAIQAPDLKTFDIYCDRVASAVGRASVRIFGDASPEAMKLSYHLGRAFQQTNILRDLGEDAARNRLYLPQELLVKHRIPTREPQAVLKHEALPAVCRDLAALTREHYAQADAAMKKCQRAAMRPAKIMRCYYGAIFDELVKQDWQDLSKRVSLGKVHKILMLAKGFFS